MRKLTQTLFLVLLAMITSTAYADNVAKIGSTEYATLAAAIQAVGDNETITMIANEEGPGIKVAEGKNFTVDFNGHTYTLNAPAVGSTNTETLGFQLLKNSTITFKDGTINIAEENKTTTAAKPIKRVIQNYANLTLENMTIDGTNMYGMTAYVVSFNNGTSEIKGNTTIKSDNIGANEPIIDCCQYYTYPFTKLKINTTGTIGGNIEISASYAANATNSKLEIINANVEGGITKGGNIDVPVAVSGGTFEDPIPQEYCADNYVPTQDANGNYTVGNANDNWVAKIGDTHYTTLNAAVGAVQAGETITLLDDAEVEATVTVNKQFTIDLNGHKVINKVENNRWMYLSIDADVTIDGTKDGSGMEIPATNTLSWGFFRLTGTGCKLTLNGGTYTGNTDDAAFVRVNQNIYATINLNNLTAETNYRFVGGDYKGANLNVTGGTYTQNNKDVLSGGKVVSAFYLEGFESVFDGVTITSQIGSCVEVASGKGTFRNNKFTVLETNNVSNWNNVAIAVSFGGEVVVESGTYNGNGGYGLYVFTSGGDVEIQGGTFCGTKASVKADYDSNSYGNNGYAVVTIDNGTFNGPLKTNNNNLADIEVSGGSFDQAVPEAFCADNYEPTPVGPDGRYTVAIEDAVVLYDNEPNGLPAVDNKTVTLANRTLYAGMWNTICLPFEVNDFTGTVLEGANVQKFVGGELNGKDLDLKFAPVDKIEKNIPYAVKPAENIYNPTFDNVSFDSNQEAASTTTNTKAEFVGTFMKKEFTTGGKEYLFIANGNKLIYVLDGPFTYPGFRGYFQVTEETAAAAQTLHLSFDEGDTTAINGVETKAETTTEDWYTISGAKLQGKPAQKGIYIMNGKKVVVK